MPGRTFIACALAALALYTQCAATAAAKDMSAAPQGAPAKDRSAAPQGTAAKDRSAARRGGVAAGSCPGADTTVADEATRQRGAQAVLCLVNRERVSRGLGSLRASDRLASAAAAHSADMVAARFFSHTSSNGDTLRRRAARAGYIRRSRYTLVGETLAWAAGTMATPAQLLVGFMESPEHRQTLLDKRFRSVGIGMALGAPVAGAGAAAATLTLDFGGRCTSAPQRRRGFRTRARRDKIF